jgi:hypothetical protein
MFTQTFTRPKLQTAVLKWFASEEYCFEQETAQGNCASALTQGPSGGLIDIGLIMGRETIGGGTPAAAVAGGGNTGNGTVGSLSGSSSAEVGTYTINMTAATAFTVTNPKGEVIGSGSTGVAFANEINFTVTAGGTPFAAGDSFTIAVPAGTAVANAGNTGNGTFGAITAKTGVQPGTYSVEFIAATKFNVTDPAGNFVAEGSTGVAFSNQLGFTITAGGTAFVAGDGFTIAMAAGTNKVVPLNLTAVDGSQNAVGVAVRQTMVPATADVPIVLVERLAVLLDDGLIYPTGASTSQKAAIRVQLTALGLLVRFS